MGSNVIIAGSDRPELNVCRCWGIIQQGGIVVINVDRTHQFIAGQLQIQRV